MKPYVFIDRDDTLIYDVPYLSDPDKAVLTPGAAEALAKLRQAGFGIILITNQSGIGRGLFSVEQMHAVNNRVRDLLRAGGADFDAVYFCPHAPQDECSCRKPKVGMLEMACRDFQVDLSRSVMVGDSSGDIQLGKNFGIRTVQIMLPEKNKKQLDADFTAPSLPDAVNFIIKS